jgi:hypothetical protein
MVKMLNQNPKLYFRITLYLRAVHRRNMFALSQDVDFCLTYELFLTTFLIACIKVESIKLGPGVLCLVG